MMDIVKYISIAGLSAAALVLMLAMLFAERPRKRTLRIFGLALGIVAIGVPILHLSTTLGRATPWITPGVYTIHGWKTVEKEGRIYLLVAEEYAEEANQFELPFDPELALELQRFQREAKKLEKLCLRVRAPGEQEPLVTTYRIMGRTYMADCPPNM